MTRAWLFLAAAAVSATAMAQDHDHHAGHTTEQPAADPHAGHAKPEATADPHAGHAMPDPPAADPHADHAMPETTVDPRAGHTMPAPAADPHAGHRMPAADPHAGHDMGNTTDEVPLAPPPPEATCGPAHAADGVFGAEAMERSRAMLAREHGGMPHSAILIDRAETRITDGPDSWLVEGDAWWGGDIHKAWFKAEIEGDWRGRPEAELQALYSHAIGPWFDVQAGVRYDARPDDDTAYAVLGVQGLAPYWFEVDAALFLSDRGDLTVHGEAEYDLRITRRLILQPRGEIALSAQDVPELGLGSGLTSASLGARLRYEITPGFAPYVGVEAERAFDDTRRFRKAEGEDASPVRVVAGLRLML